jgi:hypothetical protein
MDISHHLAQYLDPHTLITASAASHTLRNAVLPRLRIVAQHTRKAQCAAKIKACAAVHEEAQYMREPGTMNTHANTRIGTHICAKGSLLGVMVTEGNGCKCAHITTWHCGWHTERLRPFEQDHGVYSYLLHNKRPTTNDVQKITLCMRKAYGHGVRIDFHELLLDTETVRVFYECLYLDE